MYLFVKFLVTAYLILQVEALPNVFEYEIERAKEYVQSFEASGHKEKVKLGKFSWKDCSSLASIANIKIKSLSILPDPLAFPGPLNVQTEFSLKKNIDAPLKAALKIEKKIGQIYIKVPCIDNFGSCAYDDVCVLLSQIKSQCPDPVKKAGIDCSCPIKQGSYSLPKTEFNINAEIIPSGEYHVVANLTQKGAEAGCLEIYLNVE